MKSIWVKSMCKEGFWVESFWVEKFIGEKYIGCPLTIEIEVTVFECCRKNDTASQTFAKTGIQFYLSEVGFRQNRKLGAAWEKNAWNLAF